MLCHHHLKILNTFHFELVFCKWSGTMEHVLGQRRYVWYACLFTPWQAVCIISFEMSHENRILVSPWCMEVQQDLTREHSNHIKAEKLGHCQPKSFLRITTCFKCKKKTVAVWETQRNKGPFHILSCYLPVTCLYSSTTQAEMDDMERKRKTRQSVALCPLSLSPHSSAGQR